MALTESHPQSVVRTGAHPLGSRREPLRRSTRRRLFPGTPGPVALTAIRHGQSTANAAFAAAEAAGALEVGITCRDADLHLTDLGREQAAALGRWYASGAGGSDAAPDDAVPQSLWVSPYLRAQETAEQVLAELDRAGLPLPDVTTDERLRDRELGVLEMLTSAAIELYHPAEAERRRRMGELRWRPPGGESALDVAERVRSALRELFEAEPDRRVLVVAHDNVVLMLRHLLEGLTEDDLAGLLRGGSVGNTHVTTWTRPVTAPAAPLALTLWNTAPHLR